MSLSTFLEHPTHRVPAHEIKAELHKLRESGHLDDRQYHTLQDGLEAITHTSDHAVTGRDLHDWLHNVTLDHSDHISSDKVHEHLAPAFAALIKPE